jgi:hypothetical protein
MITDTAFYRYPYYHTALDTPDKLTYDAFARATEGLYGAFAALAAEAGPMGLRRRLSRRSVMGGSQRKAGRYRRKRAVCLEQSAGKVRSQQ